MLPWEIDEMCARMARLKDDGYVVCEDGSIWEAMDFEPREPDGPYWTERCACTGQIECCPILAEIF